MVKEKSGFESYYFLPIWKKISPHINIQNVTGYKKEVLFYTCNYISLNFKSE